MTKIQRISAFVHHIWPFPASDGMTIKGIMPRNNDMHRVLKVPRFVW